MQKLPENAKVQKTQLMKRMPRMPTIPRLPRLTRKPKLRVLQGIEKVHTTQRIRKCKEFISAKRMEKKQRI